MSWKGEPGHYFCSTEIETVEHLISLIQETLGRDVRIVRGDGHNSEVPMDLYGLEQTLDALKNYRTLLTKPLQELMPTGFFRTSFLCEGGDSIGQTHILPELAEVGDDAPQ